MLMNHHMAETNPKQEQLQTTMTTRSVLHNGKNNLKELLAEPKVNWINIKSC